MLSIKGLKSIVLDARPATNTSSICFAANDQSINGELHSNIQASMVHIPSEQTIDVAVFGCDAAKKTKINLKLEERHIAVVKREASI